jgi:hypothetical protein
MTNPIDNIKKFYGVENNNIIKMEFNNIYSSHYLFNLDYDILLKNKTEIETENNNKNITNDIFSKTLVTIDNSANLGRFQNLGVSHRGSQTEVSQNFGNLMDISHNIEAFKKLGTYQLIPMPNIKIKYQKKIKKNIKQKKILKNKILKNKILKNKILKNIKPKV